MPIKVMDLGFSGYGKIDNIQVLMTGGSMSRDIRTSFIQPLSLPPAGDIIGGAYRGKVKFADGTKILNGNMSFDLSWSVMGLFTTNRMLKRGYKFDAVVSDGNTAYSLKDCMASSVSLSGSAGGIITVSMSFICGSDWTSAPTTFDNTRDHEPVGYWASGNTNVKDWTLNFNVGVEPIYLNGINDTDDSWPRYLKAGIADISLEATTFDRLMHDRLTIATANFILTGYLANESYTFNGVGEFGTHHHSLTSAASLTDGSGAIVLTSS